MINRKWFAQLTINLIQLRNAISNNARNPSLNRWIICPSKWPVAELPLGASLAQFEQVRHCLFWHPVWGPFIIFLRERGILWKSAELFIVRLLRGQSDISINNLRSLNVRGHPSGFAAPAVHDSPSNVLVLKGRYMQFRQDKSAQLIPRNETYFVNAR